MHVFHWAIIMELWTCSLFAGTLRSPETSSHSSLVDSRWCPLPSQLDNAMFLFLKIMLL